MLGDPFAAKKLLNSQSMMDEWDATLLRMSELGLTGPFIILLSPDYWDRWVLEFNNSLTEPPNAAATGVLLNENGEARFTRYCACHVAPLPHGVIDKYEIIPLKEWKKYLPIVI